MEISGIHNHRLIYKKILWLSNLMLEQAMRKLASGDQ